MDSGGFVFGRGVVDRKVVLFRFTVWRLFITLELEDDVDEFIFGFGV